MSDDEYPAIIKRSGSEIDNNDLAKIVKGSGALQVDILSKLIMENTKQIKQLHEKIDKLTTQVKQHFETTEITLKKHKKE